jgi:hypothetical protein
MKTESKRLDEVEKGRERERVSGRLWREEEKR